LRKKSYYREYLEELDAAENQRAAEAQAAAVGGEDEAESTFDINTGIDNLENKITGRDAMVVHEMLNERVKMLWLYTRC
jgi:hypothetical protein